MVTSCCKDEMLMDRKLSQHGNTEGSKIPGQSLPSRAFRVLQTIAHKGVLKHISQKLTIMENFGIADLIFIYRKFIYFFLQGWKVYEPK